MSQRERKPRLHRYTLPFCPSPNGLSSHGRSRRQTMQHLTKRSAHGIHLFLVHRAEERECEAGIAGRLGHREVTPPKAELLAVEGLEVDGGEVRPGRD